MVNRSFLPYQDKGRKSKKSPKATPEKDKRKPKKDKQSYSETNRVEEEKLKNSHLENPRSKSPDKIKDGEWTMVLFDDYLKLKSTIEFQRSKIAELTSR